MDESNEEAKMMNELQKRVQLEANKQITADKDLEKKEKKSIFIYRVPEMNADNVADRRDGNMAFVTEMLESVFQVTVQI